MKTTQALPRTLPLVLLGVMILSTPAQSDEPLHRSHVIAVGVDGSETVEVDVSTMELGESRSFVLANGRTIDILNGPDGVELYADGALIDPGHDTASRDQPARVFVVEEDFTSDFDTDAPLDADHEVIVIREEIRIDSD